MKSKALKPPLPRKRLLFNTGTRPHKSKEDYKRDRYWNLEKMLDSIPGRVNRYY